MLKAPLRAIDEDSWATQAPSVLELARSGSGNPPY